MDYEIKFLERDAVEKVEGDENAKSLIGKNNLVLASAFAMITLDSNFLVKGDGVDFIETSKRIHDTEIKPIDISKITIPVTKILSSAMERSELEFPHETNKVFITLHHNNEYKNECWTITLFSTNLFLYKIKMDAITGRIVSSGENYIYFQTPYIFLCTLTQTYPSLNLLI